jgi:two-component system, NarL family, nitrate/nitrite response regulator NarL
MLRREEGESMADHAKATVLEARNAPTGAPGTPRRVVVVDDHRTFADLLQFALNAEDGLCCVGVAYDPATGLALVASERPDLVVMDYDFAGDELDGVMATAAITARHPNVHVVLLTGHADSILMQQAAEAGASSLMPKDGSLPDLLDALQRTGPGGLLVHPTLLRAIKEAAQESGSSDTPLSPREQDVLAMLAIGLRTRAIADHLGISPNTCRGYVKSLLWKLDAHSQLEAVAIARRQGLISASDNR